MLLLTRITAHRRDLLHSKKSSLRTRPAWRTILISMTGHQLFTVQRHIPAVNARLAVEGSKAARYFWRTAIERAGFSFNESQLTSGEASLYLPTRTNWSTIWFFWVLPAKWIPTREVSSRRDPATQKYRLDPHHIISLVDSPLYKVRFHPNTSDSV